MTVINYPTASIRPNILRKGEYIDGHEHTFDHLTMAQVGAFRVEVTTDKGEKGWRIIKAPTPEQLSQIFSADDVQALLDQFCFNVPANWKHKITGLDPINMFLCNYAPRNEAGEMVNTHAKDTREYYEWITGWPETVDTTVPSVLATIASYPAWTDGSRIAD